VWVSRNSSIRRTVGRREASPESVTVR
jgi:hypothetical protein